MKVQPSLLPQRKAVERLCITSYKMMVHVILSYPPWWVCGYVDLACDKQSICHFLSAKPYTEGCSVHPQEGGSAHWYAS